MASPTTVTYAVKEPDVSPRAGVPVTATLMGPGDRSDAAGVVTGSIPTVTAEDGSFSLSLLPNSAYRQSGTYYQIKISGGPAYNVVVPVSAVSVDLWSIRVDPRTLVAVPAAVPSIYLTRAERGAADGVAALGADGKVPAAQLPVGGGSVPTSRVLTAGAGLTGGGDLSADRSFAVTYGTTANTACQGNDSRLADARTPTAHTHPQSEVTNLVADLALKAPLANPAFTGTPTGITKTHVGLGNVDNTADSAKPISTATQTALDAKATKLIKRRAYVTSGNVNLNTGTSSWGVLPSSPTLAIPAVAGDWVELDCSIGRQANSNLLADVGVITGGTAIKRWLGNGGTATPGAGYEGDPGLYHTNVPVRTGARGFVVASGDLEGGNVTFAVLCKVNGAGSAVILADTATPFYWQATNYGVCDVA